MDSISRPHFLDTNYATVDPTDFLPKNGDFPQVSAEFLMSLRENGALWCWGLFFQCCLAEIKMKRWMMNLSSPREELCAVEISPLTPGIKKVSMVW